MKRNGMLLVLVILLLTALLFTGCASQSTSKSDTSQQGSDSESQTSTQTEQKTSEKKVIGALICDFSDQFQVYMMDGMKAAAEKYAAENIEFVYQDAKYDANTQMSQMENLISQNVDAIIVMPVDAKASVPMVKQAVDAKIPVISVNRKLENQEDAVTYAGSDSVESGEILMQHMAELLGGKGNIVVLQGTMGHEPQILRQQGIMNILAKYPDIKMIAEQSADWYRDKGMSVAENWFQSNMEIDAVVAHNDEMAIGALMAAKDAGVADKILIAGIDATPEALEFVEKGELAFTVFQYAKGQGAAAVDAAATVVKGGTVEKEIMIPYELVTKDKVEEYRAKYK